MSNRFSSNNPNVLSGLDNLKIIQFGVVESIYDTNGLGRIKVSIKGPAEVGGDIGLTT